MAVSVVPCAVMSRIGCLGLAACSWATSSKPLKPGSLKNVGWDGSEIVAFRLHFPSRILEHNARDLDTNQPNETGRGNILAWEQHLTDRLDGAAVDIMVEMDSQSILHRTLWLFAGAFTAAVAVLAFLIWLTMRKGGGDAAPAV